MFIFEPFDLFSESTRDISKWDQIAETGAEVGKEEREVEVETEETEVKARTEITEKEKEIEEVLQREMIKETKTVEM